MGETKPVKRERKKLSAGQVQSIRAAGLARANPERLGKQFGVSVSTIKAILTRKTWKHVP
jgi:hypothetical protein